MTEKIKLSSDIAKVIEEVIESFDGDKIRFIKTYVSFPNSWSNDILNGMDLNDLCRALYVGYIVEESMEEKLANLFEDTRKHTDWTDSNARLYMKYALEITGIDVPNDYWYDKL